MVTRVPNMALRGLDYQKSRKHRTRSRLLCKISACRVPPSRRLLLVRRSDGQRRVASAG
jgi:hypothetical protein